MDNRLIGMILKMIPTSIVKTFVNKNAIRQIDEENDKAQKLGE